MKKLIFILTLLSITMLPLNTFAHEEDTDITTKIYLKETPPVLDGTISENEYFFVGSYKSNGKGELTGSGSEVESHRAELYACYTGEAVYIAVKSSCSDHCAWININSGHYIYNAHHMTVLLVPDNPGKPVYSAPNGSWTWTALNNFKGCYEWTVIEDSNTGKNHIGDHHLDMSSKTGFEYIVKSGGGYDIYEQRIPFSTMHTEKQPVTLTPDKGTLFGLGIRIGLTDIGNGYDDDGTLSNHIMFSDAFTSGERLSNLRSIELAGEHTDQTDSSPGNSGSAPTGEAGAAVFILLIILSTGVFVSVKRKYN